MKKLNKTEILDYLLRSNGEKLRSMFDGQINEGCQVTEKQMTSVLVILSKLQANRPGELNDLDIMPISTFINSCE